MKTQFEFPAVDGLAVAQDPGVPAVSSEYRHVLDSLVVTQEQGVTQFYGGPLHLEEDQNVWLSPVSVEDGETNTYFQILYVNISLEEAHRRGDVPVSLLEVDEAGFKLTSPGDPNYQAMQSQFAPGREHILIRHCNTGMAYYPMTVRPDQDPEVVEQHLGKLLEVTGLRQPEQVVKVSDGEVETVPVVCDELDITHARRYEFAGRTVFSHGIFENDDPWAYYELFSTTPLSELPKENLLIRIDSGCDIGQIYDDHGCECRAQLQSALTDILELEEGGVIIHIPTQDGRGYGAATKMETEGMKRGVEVRTNGDDLRPMDTVSAAKALLGSKESDYDIRTFTGAGRLLGRLGVKSIVMITDNKEKVAQIEAGGVKVTRKPTRTTGANGCADHVKAKHDSKLYFSDEEDHQEEQAPAAPVFPALPGWAAA